MRVVDKGPGQLWGFCKSWAWQQLQAFLSAQGYSPQSRDMAEVLQSLQTQIVNSGWPLNPQGTMVLMYLIGKAKSRIHIALQWRPIAAAAKPLITKGKPRIAARAFTCFVEMIVDELPAGFLNPQLTGHGHMGTEIVSLRGGVNRGVDCKEQFNVIKPSAVVGHMREAAAWLTKRKHLRALFRASVSPARNWAGQGRQPIKDFG